MDSETVKQLIYQLGQNIKAQRMAQKISQERLALMIGTDQAVIARIEAGTQNSGISKYIRIADALGMPLYDLIDF